MNRRIYRFYEFMTGCGGNWRNAIFISCPACSGYCSTQNWGCLLTADRDGRPMVLSVVCFEDLSGQSIDPSECAGHISKDAFESLYRKALRHQGHPCGGVDLPGGGQAERRPDHRGTCPALC